MKIQKFILPIVIIILLSISAYFIYDLGYNSKQDEEPNTVVPNKGGVKNPDLKDFNDEELIEDLISPFTGNILFNHCNLNKKILKEIYSGNANVDSFSNEVLFLLAISNEEINSETSEESETIFLKEELNNKVKTNLNLTREIDFSDLKGEVAHYNINNVEDDKVSITIKTFGCVDAIDDVVKEVVRAEEDNNYLYIYEKIAFGINTDNREISYYYNTTFDNMVEKYNYDMDLPSDKVNIEEYPIYKYTFLKENNQYKLVSITTA